jgi:hypothetical protein
MMILFASFQSVEKESWVEYHSRKVEAKIQRKQVVSQAGREKR